MLGEARKELSRHLRERAGSAVSLRSSVLTKPMIMPTKNSQNARAQPQDKAKNCADNKARN